MKLQFKGVFSQNSHNILRRCGYHHFFDPKTGKASYSRYLGRDNYPRFHIYVHKDDSKCIELDIHIDQKRASYEGQISHSGEYDGELVEREAHRLEQMFLQFQRPPESASGSKKQKKKGLLHRLFG